MKRVASAEVSLSLIENYDFRASKNLLSAEKCDCKVVTANGLSSLAESRKRKANSGLPKIYDDKPSSVSFKVHNVEKLIPSPKTSEVVASRVIKQNNGSELKTLGPNPLKISQTAAKKRLFSVDDISANQKDLLFSIKQT